MSWFYSLPAWAALPLSLGVIVAVSVGLVALFRPMVQRLAHDRLHWDRIVGYAITTFGVIFGIFLALVAVAAYQNYSDVYTAVLREASAAAALYRDVGGLPGVGDLQADVHGYLTDTVSIDWPLMREGITPSASTDRLDVIQRELFAFQASTPSEQVIFSQTISSFNELVSARRVRLEEVQLTLPALLWAVMWVGGVVNAVLIALIEVDDQRLHMALAALVAVFIGLVLVTTAEMDHPYAGLISVGPGAFEELLEQLGGMGSR